jgi:hypothetical protein
MSKLLTTGCLLECTMGLAPTPFNADPLPGVPVENGMQAATIMQFTMGKNIAPFGTCKSPANPTTAALTAAASGALTPGPCTPMGMPWAPPSVTTSYNGIPLATIDSKCACAYGGMIQAKKLMPPVADTM